jgi:hypothetical protein
MPRIADDLFMGSAFGPNLADSNPAPMEAGVGPMGRIFTYNIVPLLLQAAGLAVAQAVAAAKNLTLTAGTGVTTTVDAMGVTRYVLDVPRCVTLVSSGAGDTTQTATVSGYDVYGQPMTARITLNGVTTVPTLKAFKSVTSIAISAATAGNISAGFNDRLGLPVVVSDAGFIIKSAWAGALAQDAGTFVAAVSTSPATALTGDVRGLYTPSSASDGSKRLLLHLHLPDAAVGPLSTRIGAFGVTQV